MGQFWPRIGPRIASGVFTNVGGNSIVFPVGMFTAAPLVMVQQIGVRGSNLDPQESVTAVTTAGCTITLSNTSGYVAGGDYRWIAMQP